MGPHPHLTLTLALAQVELRCGDVLTDAWRDADLVLVTSLCFSPTLIAWLYRSACGLRPGARVVCMQAAFDDDEGHEDEIGGAAEGGARPGAFRPVEIRDEDPRHGCTMSMSFGSANFYVYERV